MAVHYLGVVFAVFQGCCWDAACAAVCRGNRPRHLRPLPPDWKLRGRLVGEACSEVDGSIAGWDTTPVLISDLRKTGALRLVARSWRSTLAATGLSVRVLTTSLQMVSVLIEQGCAMVMCSCSDTRRYSAVRPSPWDRTRQRAHTLTQLPRLEATDTRGCRHCCQSSLQMGQQPPWGNVP